MNEKLANKVKDILDAWFLLDNHFAYSLFPKWESGMDTESQLIDGVIHLCADQEIMWSSAHFPSPGPSLHPTCFIFGRLICGPHKQMVQQVPSEIPLRTLSDGCPFLKVNPERLCRRIKDPWMLESIELPLKCPWESKETDTLVALVKEVGYMGWAAVKEELEKRGILANAWAVPISLARSFPNRAEASTSDANTWES